MVTSVSQKLKDSTTGSTAEIQISATSTYMQTTTRFLLIIKEKEPNWAVEPNMTLQRRQGASLEWATTDCPACGINMTGNSLDNFLHITNFYVCCNIWCQPNSHSPCLLMFQTCGCPYPNSTEIARQLY